MKKLFLMIFLSSLLTAPIISQDLTTFNKYFIDETMRIDYFHIGNSTEESVTLDHVYKYGIWAGSRVHLLDEMNLGRYLVKIYDAASGEVIYSRGFDSYFGEYKTSSEGLAGVSRTFSESAIIPYPKNKIIFTMERRDEEQNLFEFYRTEIEPDNVMIIRDEVKDNTVRVYDAESNGDPHNRADIVLLGEGYTVDEKSKFEDDLKYFTNVFFSQEPYKSNADKFNIHGVYKPSADSGIDEPRAELFKNTVLSCTFNSMGSERYVLTENNKAVRDLAAFVPYDAVYIMINHARYGGGGIYNFFCTFTTDNQFRDYLFLHEFGHSFSGLADEYYTSDVQYNDFYPLAIEPLEPNVTALLNAPNVKWQEYVTPGTEIPTTWEKAKYDSMDYKWQAERRELNNKIAELKRNKADISQIQAAENEYAKKDKVHSEVVDTYLKKNKNFGKVGAFEGAGYVSNGMYRPMLDCIMFSKGSKPFCTVCEKHIINIIEQYGE